MPPHPGEPLTKVTINLYTADVEELRKSHGHGWSVAVRDAVRRGLRGKPRSTVADLLKDHSDDR